MDWAIQSYLSDTWRYFVTRRGVQDWLVTDPMGTVYDGFSDENSAMAYAESLVAQNAPPPPDAPPIVSPAVVDAVG